MQPCGAKKHPSPQKGDRLSPTRSAHLGALAQGRRQQSTTARLCSRHDNHSRSLAPSNSASSFPSCAPLSSSTLAVLPLVAPPFCSPPTPRLPGLRIGARVGTRNTHKRALAPLNSSKRPRPGRLRVAFGGRTRARKGSERARCSQWHRRLHLYKPSSRGVRCSTTPGRGASRGGGSGRPRVSPRYPGIGPHFAWRCPGWPDPRATRALAKPGVCPGVGPSQRRRCPGVGWVKIESFYVLFGFPNLKQKMVAGDRGHAPPRGPRCGGDTRGPACVPPRGRRGRRDPGIRPTPGQHARGRCPGSPDPGLGSLGTAHGR